MILFFQWSGLKAPLPDNVHMLTLEQWGGPTIRPSATQPFLVRLEHIYENGETSVLSKPVKFMAKVNIKHFENEIYYLS